MNKNAIIIVTVAALFLGAVFWALKPSKKYVLPFYQYNNQTHTLEKFPQPFTELAKVGAFKCLDQNGNTYSQENIGNRIFVADYFFVTCPGICKQMGQQMQRLYKKYEKDENLVLLSYTSKPEEDSVKVLQEYSKRMKVEDTDKWKFLVGDKNLMFDLAQKDFGLLNPEDAESDFVHTERFVLVDKNKYIRGYYDGTSPQEVDQLIKDIDLLKNEYSTNE
ncbi:MAG: SCO family protein [Cytophagales bacterium]